jgi:hypothetical protein
LVLSGSPTTRWHLVALADAISHGTGFLTVASVVTEEGLDQGRIESLTSSIRQYLETRRVPAMVKVHTAESAMEGARELVKAFGFGPLVPNTVLLGETERPENVEEYVDLIRLIHARRRNLIIVRESDDARPPAGGARIDLWWGRVGRNASLMLALGYLLQTSAEWKSARLRIKTVVPEEDGRADAERGLREFLERSRLDADVEALVRDGGGVFDTIRASSRGAGLVLLGMPSPEPREDVPATDYATVYRKLLQDTEGMPPTALVLAAQEVDFGRIFEESV